jgi:hypothetical protein
LLLAGLVLFLMTLLVNLVARQYVVRAGRIGEKQGGGGAGRLRAALSRGAKPEPGAA